MPGRLDGIELAKLARVRHPGLPVLFITGRPDGAIRAQKIDKPCAVLHKPFNFAEVPGHRPAVGERGDCTNTVLTGTDTGVRIDRSVAIKVMMVMPAAGFLDDAPSH